LSMPQHVKINNVVATTVGILYNFMAGICVML
jgi:hypothetical protein